MQLSNAVFQQLMNKHQDGSIGATIHDACELLSAKMALLLKKKAGELERRLVDHEPGTPERIRLAAQVNAIRGLMVELLEVE